MKTQLEELLEAGQDLIGQIEDTKEPLDMLNASTGEIDSALAELSRQADQLRLQITAVRNEAPHLHDPVALATTQAIDNLLTLLTEAKQYFADGQNLAAFGTLVMFDEHADDLRAAIRLCRMAQRRQK